MECCGRSRRSKEYWHHKRSDIWKCSVWTADRHLAPPLFPTRTSLVVCQLVQIPRFWFGRAQSIIVSYTYDMPPQNHIFTADHPPQEHRLPIIHPDPLVHGHDNAVVGFYIYLADKMLSSFLSQNSITQASGNVRTLKRFPFSAVCLAHIRSSKRRSCSEVRQYLFRLLNFVVIIAGKFPCNDVYSFPSTYDSAAHFIQRGKT